jgi:hypothetical protein
VAGAVDFPERGADRVRMQKPPLFYVKAPGLQPCELAQHTYNKYFKNLNLKPSTLNLSECKPLTHF